MPDDLTPTYRTADSQVALGGQLLQAGTTRGRGEFSDLDAGGGENLLRNGSFQYDTDDWTAPAGTTIDRSTAEFHDDDGSLRVRNTSGGAALISASTVVTMPIRQDRTYALTAWGKAIGAGLAGFEVDLVDVDGTVLTTLSEAGPDAASFPTTGWAQLRLEFVPAEEDPDATGAVVRFVSLSNVANGDGFWIDEISLITIPQASSRSMIVGRAAGKQLRLADNEITGRDGGATSTVEVNYAPAAAAQPSGKGLYVLDGPVPPFSASSVATPPTGPGLVNTSDRSGGFTWQQTHDTYVTDVDSLIYPGSGVPAPNGLLWVGATEIDVFGFTNGHWYVWMASLDDTSPVLQVWDASGLVGAGVSTAASILWLCY